MRLFGNVKFRVAGMVLGAVLVPHPGTAGIFHVSTTGLDANPGTEAKPFRTIQKGVAVAVAGDTVLVQPGIYAGRVVFPRSGAPGQMITLKAVGAPATVALDGGGGNNRYAGLIHLENKSHIRIEGLVIRNFAGDDISGIRFLGGGDNLQIAGNIIHNIRGTHAMGITIYGTSASVPVTNLLIEGNEVAYSQPYPSEAVAVNGNISGFTVQNNHVHDMNNIGIDLIGGETSIQPDRSKVARFGVVRGNRVANCLGVDGNAVGIYVDGGRDIVVEQNRVWNCDNGVQFGAENSGATASNLVLRNNIIYRNRLEGMILGSDSTSAGDVRGGAIVHNLFYQNDAANGWGAEILIERASNFSIRNNIFDVASPTPQAIYWEGALPSGGHTLGSNLYYGPSNIDWTWNGAEFTSFSAYRSGAGDSNALFGAPQYVNAAAFDFHLRSNSPAINKGLLSAAQGRDIDGELRPNSAGPGSDSFPDIGPDEYVRADKWLRTKFPAVTDYAAKFAEDSDTDGANNLLEYAAGTDPLNAASRPGTRLEIESVSGAMHPAFFYQIDPAATDVIRTSLCGAMTGSGGTAGAFQPPQTLAIPGITGTWQKVRSTETIAAGPSRMFRLSVRLP